ncbi:hypothetical protein L1887_06059 [Cichorium endivia]|nr:hypothetical protein L1887_06059 [Cichorium endivia]
MQNLLICQIFRLAGGQRYATRLKKKQLTNFLKVNGLRKDYGKQQRCRCDKRKCGSCRNKRLWTLLHKSEIFSDTPCLLVNVLLPVSRMQEPVKMYHFWNGWIKKDPRAIDLKLLRDVPPDTAKLILIHSWTNL